MSMVNASFLPGFARGLELHGSYFAYKEPKASADHQPVLSATREGLGTG